MRLIYKIFEGQYDRDNKFEIYNLERNEWYNPLFKYIKLNHVNGYYDLLSCLKNINTAILNIRHNYKYVRDFCSYLIQWKQKGVILTEISEDDYKYLKSYKKLLSGDDKDFLKLVKIIRLDKPNFHENTICEELNPKKEIACHKDQSPCLMYDTICKICIKDKLSNIDND